MCSIACKQIVLDHVIAYGCLHNESFIYARNAYVYVCVCLCVCFNNFAAPACSVILDILLTNENVIKGIVYKYKMLEYKCQITLHRHA